MPTVILSALALAADFFATGGQVVQARTRTEFSTGMPSEAGQTVIRSLVSENG